MKRSNYGQFSSEMNDIVYIINDFGQIYRH